MTIDLFSITPREVQDAKNRLSSLEPLINNSRHVVADDAYIEKQRELVSALIKTQKLRTQNSDLLHSKIKSQRRQIELHKTLRAFWESIQSATNIVAFALVAIFLNVAIGVCSGLLLETKLAFLIAFVVFCLNSLMFVCAILLRGDYAAEQILVWNGLIDRDMTELNQLERRLVHAKQQKKEGDQALQVASETLDRSVQVSTLRAEFARANDHYQQLLDVMQSRKYQLLRSNWREMRGTDFEDFLQEVFEALGFEVEATKASGDQGIDLIVIGKRKKIGVQAKGYAGNVGNHAAMEAHAGMAFYKCDQCAVITNSDFTRQARELAQRIGCRLISGKEIPALIVGDLAL